MGIFIDLRKFYRLPIAGDRQPGGTLTRARERSVTRGGARDKACLSESIRRRRMRAPAAGARQRRSRGSPCQAARDLTWTA